MGSLYASRQLLDYLRYSYPAVTVLVFIVSFIITSFPAAKNTGEHGSAVQYGPGGRPLPKRLRSTVVKIRETRSRFSSRTQFIFAWLAAGVLGTFVVDAAIHIAHAMMAKPEKWWCGQAVVVSLRSFLTSMLVLKDEG